VRRFGHHATGDMSDDRKQARRNVLVGLGLVATGVLFASNSGPHWKRFSHSFVDAWQNHAIGWLLISMGAYLLGRVIRDKLKR
jgi:hypothetical protein